MHQSRDNRPADLPPPPSNSTAGGGASPFFHRGPLTIQQEGVLRYVAQQLGSMGSPPTHAEIAQHFGWASANSATTHIQALVRRGMLEHTPGRARGLQLTRAARALLGAVIQPDEALIGVIRLPVYTPATLPRAPA